MTIEQRRKKQREYMRRYNKTEKGIANNLKQNTKFRKNNPEYWVNYSSEYFDRTGDSRFFRIGYKMKIVAEREMICSECGTKEGEMELDHIKPRCDYPELTYVDSNVQLLCKDCHKEKTRFYREQKKIIDVREQLYELDKMESVGY